MRLDRISSARGGALLLWPVGVALTSWSHLWRTTPLHRIEIVGSPQRDLVPQIPAGVDLDRLQQADDGVGPLFHRRFVARAWRPRMNAEEITSAIAGAPDRVAPTGFAHVRKSAGMPGAMRCGDEFLVRMPGPWNGPVRVVEVTPTSFRLATLEGHLEAGQVEFRALDDSGVLELRVETWSRSRDPVSRILYQHLRMAKEVQLHMWTSLLERAAGLSGGRLTGGIEVVTREVAGEGMRPGDDRARRRLDDLHHRAVNFDQRQGEERSPGTGWTTDQYRQPLPPEQPGAPVPGGSWEVARDLVRRYVFADPAIIRAVYWPDLPLLDRDMLLEARFHGMRFHFGVRVSGVRDEIAQVEGRRVRVWGWNYRTLQGHLEEGQMDFEVWKWLDSGDVEFCTRRFARRADIRNPVIRVGFRLFGRREQVRFARHACDRMARLTAALLEKGDTAPGVSTAAEGIDLRSPAAAGRPDGAV